MGSMIFFTMCTAVFSLAAASIIMHENTRSHRVAKRLFGIVSLSLFLCILLGVVGP